MHLHDESRTGACLLDMARTGPCVGDAATRAEALARNGESMLPDFRFVIGAGLATAFLGVTSVGLLATVRLTHQGKVGPLESSRTLAFDRADWNQFADPESVRRFDERARKVDAVEHAAQPASDQPTSTSPAAAQAPIEPPAYDHQAETVAAPADMAAAAEAKAPELVPPLDLAPPPPARPISRARQHRPLPRLRPQAAHRPPTSRMRDGLPRSLLRSRPARRPPICRANRRRSLLPLPS